MYVHITLYRMSNEKKPRQILGFNNIKLENETEQTFVNYPDNERMYSEHVPVNKPQISDNKSFDIHDEYQNFKNKSKDSVVMNFENINRMFSEGMSYWPYPQFISPFCMQQTGLLAPAPAPGFYPQVPYYPAQFAPQTQEYSYKLPDSNVVPSKNGKPSINTSFVNVKENENSTSSSTLNEKQSGELTLLAMRGSETAERIAYTHRNRPCFKKIDSLCARMKQDLIRPDGVLPNINSQGIAWAVKDLIFVFTRIINAWIIVKGYIYNTPEGLNKIKAEFSSDFIGSFAVWQDATVNFVENLIKSFVNLDQLVQNQNIAKKVENGVKTNSFNTPVKTSINNINIELNGKSTMSLEHLKLNVVKDLDIAAKTVNESHYSSLVEDSRQKQRKTIDSGVYIKTGVYNPILKQSNNEDDDQDYFSKTIEPFDIFETGPVVSNFENGFKMNGETSISPDALGWTNQLPTVNSLSISKIDSSYPFINSFNNVYKTPNNEKKDNFEFSCIDTSYVNKEIDTKLLESINIVGNEKTTSSFEPYDIKMLETNIHKFPGPFVSSVKLKVNDTKNKLEILLEKIQSIPEGNLFLEGRFMKNYFPDFMMKSPKFLDLRSIIMKAQIGGYDNVNGLVQDLKLISQHVNSYLKVTKNEMLETAINQYETAINKVLCDEFIKDCSFDMKNELDIRNSLNF